MEEWFGLGEILKTIQIHSMHWAEMLSVVPGYSEVADVGL